MLQRPLVAEPLWYVIRDNLEKVLVQRCLSTCPDIDQQRSRPRKDEVAIVDFAKDVVRLDLSRGRTDGRPSTAPNGFTCE